MIQAATRFYRQEAESGDPPLLEALFTRYGGRGPTLGQKFLDYREYLAIAVEIRRQGGAQWERVNPSRLSTGEAIGIGTALMMVVLTSFAGSGQRLPCQRKMRHPAARI